MERRFNPQFLRRTQNGTELVVKLNGLATTLVGYKRPRVVMKREYDYDFGKVRLGQAQFASYNPGRE